MTEPLNISTLLVILALVMAVAVGTLAVAVYAFGFIKIWLVWYWNQRRNHE